MLLIFYNFPQQLILQKKSVYRIYQYDGHAQPQFKKTYCPEDRNPWPVWFEKHVSQCIHKISKCHWILENEPRNPIINRIHAPTKVNGCPNCEQDLLNIVGCRMVMSAGQTDRWHRARQYPMAYMG